MHRLAVQRHLLFWVWRIILNENEGSGLVEYNFWRKSSCILFCTIHNRVDRTELCSTLCAVAIRLIWGLVMRLVCGGCLLASRSSSRWAGYHIHWWSDHVSQKKLGSIGQRPALRKEYLLWRLWWLVFRDRSVWDGQYSKNNTSNERCLRPNYSSTRTLPGSATRSSPLKWWLYRFNVSHAQDGSESNIYTKSDCRSLLSSKLVVTRPETKHYPVFIWQERNSSVEDHETIITRGRYVWATKDCSYVLGLTMVVTHTCIIRYGSQYPTSNPRIAWWLLIIMSGTAVSLATRQSYLCFQTAYLSLEVLQLYLRSDLSNDSI